MTISRAQYFGLACIVSLAFIGAPSAGSSDPLVFGQGFKSVCRVGKRGGDGTLIAPRWVLTAAHVAKGMFERTDGNLSVFCEDKEFKVQDVFLHPEWGPMNPNDIALLRLRRPAEGYEPFPIYKKSDEQGQRIVIAGHGDKRDQHGGWIKDGKLRAYTNEIDEARGPRIVFDYDGPDDNPTPQEGTSGPGDSGGPALIADGDTYRVAGISSMGMPGVDGPATFGAIEHFVRVSEFQDWIEETIRNPYPSAALSAATVRKSGGSGQR